MAIGDQSRWRKREACLERRAVKLQPRLQQRLCRTRLLLPNVTAAERHPVGQQAGAQRAQRGLVYPPPRAARTLLQQRALV